jgi:hypothetical protein
MNRVHVGVGKNTKTVVPIKVKDDLNSHLYERLRNSNGTIVTMLTSKVKSRIYNFDGLRVKRRLVMRKVQIVFVLMICFAVLLTGCGGGGNEAPSAPPNTMVADVEFDVDFSVDEPEMLLGMVAGAQRTESNRERRYALELSEDSYSHVETAVETQRMIVTTASFTIRTDDFESAMLDIQQMIRASGGFVQQSDSFAATETRGASANMTIRIPTQRYEGFREFIMELGEVTFFSEGGEDVTVQFFDTEARLAVLREQEIRIRSFIEHAQNLEEIFIIERELTRISTEIEQLTTVRDRLRNLVSYATINLHISDGAFTPHAAAFGSRMDNAFSGSIDVFIAFVQGTILFIIWTWPMLTIAAVIVFLVRRRKKRRKEAEALRQSQMQQAHQVDVALKRE